MPLEFSSKVKGFEDFDRLLRELPDRVNERVIQNAASFAMRVGAKVVMAAAPEDLNRPPETNNSYWARKLRYGRLRDKKNIKVKSSKRDKQTGSRGAYITTGMAFWGSILELGSRYYPATPWFLPAITSAKDLIIKALGIEIGIGIKREARKKE